MKLKNNERLKKLFGKEKISIKYEVVHLNRVLNLHHFINRYSILIRFFKLYSL